MILTAKRSSSVIQVDGFGFMPGDSRREIVRRYTMTNKNKASVRLISLGAGIQSISIPNSNDDLADVVLGFDNVADYLKNRYIGRIIINRSSNPFAKDSSEKSIDYSSDIVNWDSYIVGDRVVMTRVSQIMGHSGYLMTQVSFVWSDDNRLYIEIRATSTRPTPVDIASYCLFNLAGHGTGPKELRNHVVTINADKWMELNVPKEMVTGRIEDFKKLCTPTRLSSEELFKVPGGGYNHHLSVISPSSSWAYRFHARILHSTSGRSLEVYSNHPSLQLYTGNNLPDPKRFRPNDKGCEKNKRGLVGKNGMLYARHGCFALVPQGYPKACCPTDFPFDNVLRPGKIYVHDITYDFGVLA